MNIKSIIEKYFPNTEWYNENCICPYCGNINFDYKEEHSYYEIWTCKNCGKKFGVKIEIKKVFIYKIEKL